MIREWSAGQWALRLVVLAGPVLATLAAGLTGDPPSRLAVATVAVLSLGFALFPALVPIVVQTSGWQMAFTLLIAPLLLVSAAAALTLPNILSGRDIDAE